MESSIFRFVLRHSRREQVLLLLLTFAGFPFLYLSLDLPKMIINRAIGGKDFPRAFFGHELDQIPYLLVLCGVFLVLVLINGAFKYYNNVYRGVVGERMLRRLRYELITLVLRFPVPQFRKISQGEIVSMIMSETEPLGGYIGDAVALPAFQGGTLITILAFMFVQDWVLGLAAIALYPMQLYVIPRLQRRVNALRRERILTVRKLSERVGEIVYGIREVHSNDTSQFELSDCSERLAAIYDIRVVVYRLKFFIKFINNFLAQITPFFFYSIGGYLVIKGQLSFGALVAVLAAYKDLSAPWKELLTYYQTMEDARTKYDLLYDTFLPPGMLDERLQTEEPATLPRLTGELVAGNVDLSEADEGDAVFPGGVTMRLNLPTRVALVGDGGSGRDRLAAILAGIRKPLAGSLTVDGVDLISAPEGLTGRRIGYVGTEPSIRAGSIRDNLVYPLMHRPLRPGDLDEEQRAARAKALHEAQLAGNSPYDITADWVDYEAAGVSSPEAFTERALEVLGIADVAGDVYRLGLQGILDEARYPGMAERVLEARAELRNRLADPETAPLVDLFDRDRYNANMSVAENLLFGTPRDPSFNIENLPDNAYVRKVLHETGLMPDFIRIGREVAALMVDLFADVEPGSDLFEQFSFIDADSLPAFRSLLARTADAPYASLSPADRRMLLSLPFKLVAARHRLGVLDESLQGRLLEARHALARGFGLGQPPVEFFDPQRFNPAVSIQDNILYGRLAYGKARSASRIGELIDEVVDKLDLRREVTEIGLDFQVGVTGSRLTSTQRIKLAIARAVLKYPDILIVDQATSVLDDTSQRTVMENLLREFSDRTLIWLIHRASLGEHFEHVLVMEGGKIVEQGRYEELNQPGRLLSELALTG